MLDQFWSVPEMLIRGVIQRQLTSSCTNIHRDLTNTRPGADRFFGLIISFRCQTQGSPQSMTHPPKGVNKHNEASDPPIWHVTASGFGGIRCVGKPVNSAKASGRQSRKACCRRMGGNRYPCFVDFQLGDWNYKGFCWLPIPWFRWEEIIEHLWCGFFFGEGNHFRTKRPQEGCQCPATNPWNMC